MSGDAVAVSVMGAPTDTVHFAYRLGRRGRKNRSPTPAPPPTAAPWPRLPGTPWDLPDDDYEFVALYTEDDGYSVIYDAIEGERR